MNDLREQLQSIYDQHGQLTPHLVVRAAQKPDHPLHSRFDWDNKVAGPKWRLEQARTLIQSVKVIYKEDDPTAKVHGFYSLRRGDGWSYEPLDKIVENEDSVKIVLTDMEREWRQLRSRYDAFGEFWELVRKDSDGK